MEADIYRQRLGIAARDLVDKRLVQASTHIKPPLIERYTMNDNTFKACDLCGLPVETANFSLFTVNGRKQFCCEGCHGIYQMLHESEILADPAELAVNEAGP